MKRRFIRRQIREKIPKPTKFVRIPAVMGDGDGNIKVSSRTGYVYVRFLSGQIWEVYGAGNAPSIENYRVWIGTSENMPTRMHVLSLEDVYGDPGTDDDDFDPATLIWPGRNTLWIRAEQFLPGLAVPIADTMNVRFLPWKIVFDGTIILIRQQTINFTSYIPTDGAKWLLIEYDHTGDLNVVEGALVAAKSLLNVNNIPSPTAGSKHFWALKVYVGQTEIAWTVTNNDLVDLRWSGAVSGNATYEEYDPANLNDWDYLADPGFVADALDQLAARTTDLEEITTAPRYRQLVTVSDGSGGWEFVTAGGEPVWALQFTE